MSLDSLGSWVECFMDDDHPDGAPLALPMPSAFAIRYHAPSPYCGIQLGPFAGLILQGNKEMRFGSQHAKFAPGQAMIVSHDIPVEYSICKAAKDEPFLAVIILLDFEVLYEIRGHLDEIAFPEREPTSSELESAEQHLVVALERYLKLSETPIDREILAPSVLREIHLRLLQSQNGALLRQMLMRDSHASNIGRSIAMIRENYCKGLQVAEIASKVGMSKTLFYEHFQRITGATPAQFIKEVRLESARRMLARKKDTVSATAVAVGYTSMSQFSRDYKQRFGVSPSDHLAKAAA